MNTFSIFMLIFIFCSYSETCYNGRLYDEYSLSSKSFISSSNIVKSRYEEIEYFLIAFSTLLNNYHGYYSGYKSNLEAMKVNIEELFTKNLSTDELIIKYLEFAARYYHEINVKNDIYRILKYQKNLYEDTKRHIHYEPLSNSILNINLQFITNLRII
ncbi:hypothetical protein cand_037900 [Cryptosporidium andersoni]|uniref:Uncharacterized protein n=1 Tax=Cryptosporidium andersoni TaxID=117008 RepID=A0A1J4MV21_9CRYT|nr:hypothetical protein cand_037900 [Cryptosporidium andersoni]